MKKPVTQHSLTTGEALGMAVSDVHDTLTQRAYGKRRGEAVAYA